MPAPHLDLLISSASPTTSPWFVKPSMFLAYFNVLPTDVDRWKDPSNETEDIRTAAHSPKGDKAHPRHSVEDERPSNAVRHLFNTSQLGGVTNAVSHVTSRHCLSLLTTPMKRNEHPPQPSTIGHEDHHLDRRLTTRAH